MTISFSDIKTDPSLIAAQHSIAAFNGNFTKAATKASEIHDPSQTAQTLTDWVVSRADPNPLVGFDRDIALDLARDKASTMPAEESAAICKKLIDAMGSGRVSPHDAQLYLLIIGDIVESRGGEIVGSGAGANTLAKEVGLQLAATTGVIATMFQANPNAAPAVIPNDRDCFSLGLRLLGNLADHGGTITVQRVIAPHVPMMVQFATAEPSLDPDNRFRMPAANFLEAAGEGAALDAARFDRFAAEIRSSNMRPDLTKIMDFIENSGKTLDLSSPVTGAGPESCGELLSRALHIDLVANRSGSPSVNAQKLAEYLGEPANYASLNGAARDAIMRAHLNIAGNTGSTDFLVDNVTQIKDVIDVSALNPREQLRELENISAVIEMKLAQAPGIKGRNIHLLDDARAELASNFLSLCGDATVGSQAAQQLCALAHSGNNPIARRTFYDQLKNGRPETAIFLADALSDAIEGGVIKRDALDMKALRQAQMAFSKFKRFGDYRWFNKDADPNTRDVHRMIRSLRQGEKDNNPSTNNTPNSPQPASGKRSFGEWLADQARATMQVLGKGLILGLKVAAVVAVGTLAAGAGSALIPLLSSAGVVHFATAAAMSSISTLASAATGILVGGFAAVKLLKRH